MLHVAKPRVNYSQLTWNITRHCVCVHKCAMLRGCRLTVTPHLFTGTSQMFTGTSQICETPLKTTLLRSQSHTTTTSKVCLIGLTSLPAYCSLFAYSVVFLSFCVGVTEADKVCNTRSFRWSLSNLGVVKGAVWKRTLNRMDPYYNLVRSYFFLMQ